MDCVPVVLLHASDPQAGITEQEHDDLYALGGGLRFGEITLEDVAAVRRAAAHSAPRRRPAAPWYWRLQT
jgi:hypothetical protein